MHFREPVILEIQMSLFRKVLSLRRTFIHGIYEVINMKLNIMLYILSKLSSLVIEKCINEVPFFQGTGLPFYFICVTCLPLTTWVLFKTESFTLCSEFLTDLRNAYKLHADLF